MALKVSTRADDVNKHEFDVNYLLFHKGKLYSAGDDGKIKAWASDLTFLTEVQAHASSVYSLAASDDSLFSCSNEGSVKSWDLNTLKEKNTIVKEHGTEFWTLTYDNGVLYIGDDQGNVKIFKDKFYGSINVAEPVKHMVVSKNLLFSAKDNDVVVTDLHLEGEKVQFGVKSTLLGRGPLSIVDNLLIYSSRDGKDLYTINISGSMDKPKQFNASHELIINALASVNWDGKHVVFSGGWEKIVKKWNVVGENLEEAGSCDVDIVINSLAIGEKGQLYAAGGDGHIVCVNV